MATSTQIKTNIQQHVVDKTVAKSISNVELGNDMKSIVDYVDQEKQPYKKYTAVLVFTNGVITTTVLENTIGDGSADGVNDLLWSYQGPTEPKVTMTNGTPFTINKTVVIPTIYGNNERSHFSGIRTNNNEILFSSNLMSGNGGLSFNSDVFVEIRVYL